MTKLLLSAAVILIAATALPAQDISGTWQGTLEATPPIRAVIQIAKPVNDVATGAMYRIDQDGRPIAVTFITLQGNTVKFSIDNLDATYAGQLGADGSSIHGTWTHASTTHPFNLVRATPQTAWAIPPPPTGPRQMPADARPGFEVVTIKPNNPTLHPNLILDYNGRHLTLAEFSVNDLITFAYGLHIREVTGAPAWFDSERYDIDGVPDVEGDPSVDQMRIMVQKLLADRFQFAFHHDKKVLAVYELTLGKGAPKLETSGVGPNDEYTFAFPHRPGGLQVRNLTMAEFAINMQSYVLDRPVVDHTGLTGRYDFNLDWTPDDAQFAQLRKASGSPPPAPNDSSPWPSLFTAIQEQIGLKLAAVKIPTDVIVIDHVEKPSPN
jgi:uncharacterized protein (TIGR03435 family)